MTLNNESHFGHEVQYAYSRTQLNIGGVEQGMAIHQGGYNFLLYATKEGTRIRPFATGGVGFANYRAAGILGRLGRRRQQVRSQLRRRGKGARDVACSACAWMSASTPRPSPSACLWLEGWLRQTEISAGFGVSSRMFGRAGDLSPVRGRIKARAKTKMYSERVAANQSGSGTSAAGGARACPRAAFGLDPSRKLTQYVHRIWQSQQGLPQGSHPPDFSDPPGLPVAGDANRTGALRRRPLPGR